MNPPPQTSSNQCLLLNTWDSTTVTSNTTAANIYSHLAPPIASSTQTTCRQPSDISGNLPSTSFIRQRSPELCRQPSEISGFRPTPGDLQDTVSVHLEPPFPEISSTPKVYPEISSFQPKLGDIWPKSEQLEISPTQKVYPEISWIWILGHISPGFD